MYDFWFTMGTLVMDPGLLPAIQTARPQFERVQRTFTETTNGEPPREFDNQTAGLLDKDATLRVRKAIWNYLHQHPPVSKCRPLPISLYTAGRLCQLMTIPEIRFESKLGMYGEAYHDTLRGFDPGTFSEGLPALVGLCTVDWTLAQIFWGSDPDQVLPDVQAEFGLGADGQEWRLIERFVNHPQFKTAIPSFLKGPDDENPWSVGCLDQFVFWMDKSERAIL
jgi:hypothetical protein